MKKLQTSSFKIPLLLTLSLLADIHTCYQYSSYEVTDDDQKLWLVEVEQFQQWVNNSSHYSVESCHTPWITETSYKETRSIKVSQIYNPDQESESSIIPPPLPYKPSRTVQSMIKSFYDIGHATGQPPPYATIPVYTSPSKNFECSIQIKPHNNRLSLHEQALIYEQQTGPKAIPFLKSDAYFRRHETLNHLGPREQALLEKFKPGDFKDFFDHIFPGGVGVIDEAKIINSFALYQFVPFVEYIKTLKEFKPHLAQLEYQLKNDNNLVKQVAQVQGFNSDTFLRKMLYHLNPAHWLSNEQPVYFKSYITYLAETEISQDWVEREALAISHRPAGHYGDQCRYIINELDRRAEEQHKTSLPHLLDEYNALLDLDIDSDNLLFRHMQRRREVIEKECKQQSFVSTKNYHNVLSPLLSNDEHNLLHSCTGTKLQHHMHQEYLKLFDALNNSKDDWPEKHILEADGVRFIAADGVALNRLGYTEKSSKVLDFCWATLDYLCAIGEGVQAGAANVACDLVNPAQFIQNEALFYLMLTILLKDVAELSFAYIFNDESTLKESKKNLSVYQTTLQKFFDEKIKNASHRDVVKLVAQMATERILRGRISYTCSATLAKAGIKIPTLAQGLKMGANALAKGKDRKSIAQAAKTAVKAVKKWGNPIPWYHQCKKTLRRIAEKNKIPLAHLPSSATKDAIMDLQHISVGHTLPNGKVSGLHHITETDLGGPIKQYVEVVQQVGNKIADVKITANGSTIPTPKTVFLSEYSLKDIAQGVKEALCKCTNPWEKSTVIKDAFTKITYWNNIEILVVFKNNQICSFYPTLNNFSNSFKGK